MLVNEAEFTPATSRVNESDSSDISPENMPSLRIHSALITGPRSWLSMYTATLVH